MSRGTSEVRPVVIEMFQEAMRWGAAGWVDDVLRLGRPWPGRLEEIKAEVVFHHGEDDANARPRHAKELPRGYREADCACTPARDTSPSSMAPSRGSWRTCSHPDWDSAFVHRSLLRHAIHPSGAWKGSSAKLNEDNPFG